MSTQNGPPPASPHVLKPHHVVLLCLMLYTFTDSKTSAYPPDVQLHCMRLLIDEVSEMSEPRTFSQLLKEIVGDHPKGSQFHAMRDALAQLPRLIDDDDSAIVNIFKDMEDRLVMERDEMPDRLSCRFERRSLFGMFCRRCFLSFRKLSFQGVIQLKNDFCRWCDEGKGPGPSRIRKDSFYPPTADEKEWAKPEYFEQFKRASAIGEQHRALENLHRFFEQHFPEGAEQSLRQHALLHLARHHFSWGQLGEARNVLNEAIAVARTSGDSLVLQHCMSLLRRFPPSEDQEIAGPVTIPISPHQDVLWEIDSLLKSKEPISYAFEKIIESLGCYDYATQTNPSFLALPQTEQMSQHAIQSILWHYLGSERLASIEEDAVIALTDPGSDDDRRFKVITAKARRAARQGNVETALSIALDPDTWRGLSLLQYKEWASTIWNILVLTATRRSQDRLYFDCLEPKNPSGKLDLSYYYHDQDEERSDAEHFELYRAMQLRRVGEISASMKPLLKELWSTEFSGNFQRHRTALIMYADLASELGMEKKSIEILEDLMPQLISGDDDIEQRAFACHTMARCLVADGEGSVESCRSALQYLAIAEEDYTTLQISAALSDVQFYMSAVQNKLGNIPERDDAARRHFKTVEDAQQWNREDASADIEKVWDVVKAVGVAIATKGLTIPEE
ncbi:hypothetical protein SISNIDRAFT_448191 [Sistotremastrum niveocremeum HHB9708]|uniref:Anaphase-promoting complex subunit 5 n=2 Tax=Sistotremastraceae TaxID=3402574 RepID=A0A165AMT1_9AGAM|nr:hypothetical protein SISNIDRAFT_448191 [Sistotremastrum niveocremeum HHB9708]KZT36964.1 hypothetical protein SISSUDRAFT_1049087 [Sistotremastrum suecicum HHB10207 ss-3]